MSSEKRQIRSYSTHGKRAAYCREKDLPRLTGLWPGEINSMDIKKRQQIIATLKNALRLERQRGRSRHWCYDINRHLALKQALTHELAELKNFAGQRRRPPESVSRRRVDPAILADQAGNTDTGQPASNSHPLLFLMLPTVSSS